MSLWSKPPTVAVISRDQYDGLFACLHCIITWKHLESTLLLTAFLSLHVMDLLADDFYQVSKATKGPHEFCCVCVVLGTRVRQPRVASNYYQQQESERMYSGCRWLS